MYAKSFVLGFAMVIFLPTPSVAETYGTSSVEEMRNSFPNGSIVIISKEETDKPDYIHARYAFVDQVCGSQVVDHYGRPVDPNDRDLKQTEQRMCTELAMNTRDGD